MAVPIIALNDVWRLVACCSQTNQVGLNDVWYKVTSVAGGTGFPVDQLPVTFDVSLGPAWSACMTNIAQYYGSSWTRYDVPTGVAVSGPWTNSANSIAGVSGPNPLPGQVSGLLTKKTGLPGRGFRGRLYVPFPDQSDLDPIANTPTNFYVTDLIALGVGLGFVGAPLSLFAGGTTILLTPQLRSKHLVPMIMNAVINQAGRKKFATQKRRGNYGRANELPW